MFDFLSRNKRVAQVIMVLIAVPFLFFGVDYYFRGAGPQGELAKVGDVRISPAAFDMKMREQQDQARQQLGEMFDPAIYNTPQARFAVLNQMITETLLQQKAVQEHFRVSEDKAAEVLAGIEAFHVDGQFSPERYKEILLRQNMTPATFRYMLQSSLLVAPLTESLQGGEISAQSTAERFYQLSGEKREVAMAQFETASFIKQVKISDDDIAAYYQQNTSMLQTPEKVSLDYVILSRSALQAKITVPEEKLREVFERDKERYSQPETRNVAHILIAVAGDAKDSDKAAAQKKAEDVLNKVKEAPDKFAALAREYSQDPGSAVQGGDLGVAARGTFVRPFEDAVFGAQENGIVGPVETEYGYHIIKVTIHPAQVPAFEAVKAKVESDVRQNEANEAYARDAEEFMNFIHEQTDSFDELSKKLNITVSHAEFLTRTQVAQLANGNPRFAEVVFAPETLRDRQNTEAIEAGNDAMISARVIDYKPAEVRPLDEVKNDIRKLLENRAAFELARKTGEEKLAQLQQGKSEKELGLTFGKPVTITRQQQQPQDFTADAQAAAFRAEAGKLPAYLGATMGQTRFTIYRVDKITPPETADAAQITSVAQRLDDMRGQEVLRAYTESLREQMKVVINQEKLDSLPR